MPDGGQPRLHAERRGAPARRRGSPARRSAGSARGRAARRVATVAAASSVLVDGEVGHHERRRRWRPRPRGRRRARTGSRAGWAPPRCRAPRRRGRGPHQVVARRRGPRSFSSRMPPWSAEIASSLGEQSIPFDTTPRSSCAVERLGSAGTRAPGGAHGHEVARAHVAHAHDDLVLAGAVVARGRRRACRSSGWSRDVEDARDDHALAARPTGAATPSTFTPRAVEQLGELVRRRGRWARTRAATRATTFTPSPPHCVEEADVAVEQHADVGDPVPEHRHAVDARCRTRTPCSARGRSRSSPGRSGAPCRRRAARSTRCRRCGSRRRRTRSTTRRPPRRARRTGSRPGPGGPAGPRRTAPSRTPRASPSGRANVMPSSTASPSTWWNTGVWVASGVSRRNTRPGATT